MKRAFCKKTTIENFTNKVTNGQYVGRKKNQALVYNILNYYTLACESAGILGSGYNTNLVGGGTM